MKRAFTLVELLVAIAIFVVLLGMAVVSVRSLTGSRSVATAQNLLSAQLARVRNEAIGQQQHRAAMFILDTNTGRVSLMTLKESAYAPVAALGGYAADVWFDLDTNSEPVLLPVGVGLQTVLGGTGGNRYVGFNRYSMFSVRPGGVIAFTPEGRLFVGSCGMAFSGGVNTTSLAKLLFNAPTNPTAYDGCSWVYANVALAVFDADPFLSLHGGEMAWEDDPMYGTAEQSKEAWLNENATPLIVNRYNGTLIPVN
jgi:prepilin-type N-terminal cleavage/methylation domain-containing protein